MIFGITRERDPHLIALEKDIFSSLRQISEEDDRAKNIPENPQKWVGALSVEDAIKELIALQKQNKM